MVMISWKTYVPHAAANIVANLKKIMMTSKIHPPIMESEVDTLQYVAGYVIYKFLRKAKNNLTYDSIEIQAIILTLEAISDSTTLMFFVA